MSRKWESSSVEERVTLLINTYEAFAKKAASEMKAGFVLPRSTSYRGLLAVPHSDRARRRQRRVKSIFRRLVLLLDEKGIFYRDFLFSVFETWERRQRSREFYRFTYRVPAAFPLPQHLLDQRAIDAFYKFTSDTPDPERLSREAVVATERLVANLVECYPGRYPDVRAVLQDPHILNRLASEYLRGSEEFRQLVVSGYYRENFGEEAHQSLVRFLNRRAPG
jgi:hypothetical protein